MMKTNPPSSAQPSPRSLRVALIGFLGIGLTASAFAGAALVRAVRPLLSPGLSLVSVSGDTSTPGSPVCPTIDPFFVPLPTNSPVR